MWNLNLPKYWIAEKTFVLSRDLQDILNGSLFVQQMHKMGEEKNERESEN